MSLFLHGGKNRMADKELDQGKRRFLLGATGVVGGVAGLLIAEGAEP